MRIVISKNNGEKNGKNIPKEKRSNRNPVLPTRIGEKK